VNSLPKTVTRQRRDCDLNPDPSAPESSTLTTRLPSLPQYTVEESSCNSVVHSVSRNGIYGMRMHSPIGANLQFCCNYYGIVT